MFKSIHSMMVRAAALAAATGLCMSSVLAQTEEALKGTYYLGAQFSSMSDALGLSYSNIYTSDVLESFGGQDVYRQAISLGGVHDVDAWMF